MFIHARVCVCYVHGRASIARPACPGLLHSIRDIPHSSHTNASVEVPRRHEMQRHLWARGTSEPFTGHQRILAFCAVGSANPPLQPHFVVVRRIESPGWNKIGFSGRGGSRKKVCMVCMGCSIVYDVSQWALLNVWRRECRRLPWVGGGRGRVRYVLIAPLESKRGRVERVYCRIDDAPV